MSRQPIKLQKPLPDGIPQKKVQYPHKKIDIEKALELRCKGLSYQDIGNYFGVTKQTAHEALQPYNVENRADVDVFKKKRADLLAVKQLDCLTALTVDDIKAASARDKAIIFGTLYDKERLERGQSTQNVAHVYASAVLQAAEMDKKEIEPVTEMVTEAEVIQGNSNDTA